MARSKSKHIRLIMRRRKKWKQRMKRKKDEAKTAGPTTVKAPARKAAVPPARKAPAADKAQPPAERPQATEKAPATASAPSEPQA